MKPTPATLQINGGPPITLTVDHITLTEDRPISAIIPRLQLRLEFPLTPEFAGWWRTLVYPRAQDWTAEQEAQWRAVPGAGRRKPDERQYLMVTGYWD